MDPIRDMEAGIFESFLLPPFAPPLLPHPAHDDVIFAKKLFDLKMFWLLFFQFSRDKTALLSSSQKHHTEPNYTIVVILEVWKLLKKCCCLHGYLVLVF